MTAKNKAVGIAFSGGPHLSWPPGLQDNNLTGLIFVTGQGNVNRRNRQPMAWKLIVFMGDAIARELPHRRDFGGTRQISRKKVTP
jgi:hypothetical protein